MGDIELIMILPVPAAVFGIFLGAVVLYIIYSAAKFVISIATGTS